MTEAIEIRNIYLGPQQLAADLETSLREFSQGIALEVSESPNHTTLQIQGFSSHEAVEAAGVYLACSIAGIFGETFRIRRTLLSETNDHFDLLAGIESVIGGATPSEHFKTHKRNPWIWEGISHLLLHVSSYAPDEFLPGRVMAKSGLKNSVHDHGLDVIALLESGTLELFAGECKAYMARPSDGISDASEKLKECVDGLRDLELRSEVVRLLDQLPDTSQEEIPGAFWNRKKVLAPFVCCDESHECDWQRDRLPLRRLASALDDVFLIPLAIREAEGVFDSIGMTMRAYAAHRP